MPLGVGSTDEAGEKGDGDEEVDEDFEDEDETLLLLLLPLLKLASSPPVDDNIWREREKQRNKEVFDACILVQ